MILVFSVIPVCTGGTPGIVAGTLLAGLSLAILIKHWELE